MDRYIRVKTPKECDDCPDSKVLSCMFHPFIAEKEKPLDSKCFDAMGNMATNMLDAKVEKNDA